MLYEVITVELQLQDPTYCGGSGPLGATCGMPEPAPGSGLLALVPCVTAKCLPEPVPREQFRYGHISGRFGIQLDRNNFV